MTISGTNTGSKIPLSGHFSLPSFLLSFQSYPATPSSLSLSNTTLLFVSKRMFRRYVTTVDRRRDANSSFARRRWRLGRMPCHGQIVVGD